MTLDEDKEQSSKQGRLCVVPTPIGNLEDISLRALRRLKEVDLIAAEDTRHTKKLLNHFDIHVPLFSYYKEVEQRKTTELVERMHLGEQIALVTDAGAPAISDPGQILIHATRQEGIAIEILPGPSAVVNALVGAGIVNTHFSFFGFTDAKSGSRIKFFDSIKNRAETLVFFVSPHKLKATLEDMMTCWGPRHAVLCKEMTKIHETYIEGSLEQLIRQLGDSCLGEYTVVVQGNLNPEPLFAESIDEHLNQYLDQGLKLNQAVGKVAKERGVPRQEIYDYAHNLFEK